MNRKIKVLIDYLDKKARLLQRMSITKTSEDLSCSVNNVLSASLPMMVSILSGAFMQLIDRALLAHYSINAVNSASLAQQVYNTFMLPCLCFASMAEVFVGQFNGAKLFHKTATPILQITLFLIFLEIITFPFILYFRHSIIPESLYTEGYPYFLIGLIIIPFQIIHAAFAAFFVGTRRPSIILHSVFIANIINITFDWVFIFGIENWIQPMGAMGAAWSTLLSTITSVFILCLFYFNAHNTKYYHTRYFSIDIKILKKNIFLGAPYALGVFIEMSNWVAVTNILEKTSYDEVTTNSLCLSLWSFLFFIIEGFQKGIMALASNCIGARKENYLPRLVKSILKISIFVFILSFLPFVAFPQIIFQKIFKISNIYNLPHFQMTLVIQWLSFTILVFTMSGLMGILNAGGDTKFVTFIRISCFVTCVVIPVILISSFGTFTTLHSWSLGLVNTLIAGFCLFHRYKSQRWKHILIE